MSLLSLLLCIPLGAVALIAFVALPFVWRSTRRDLREETTTTGRVVGFESCVVNETWYVDVAYQVGGVGYQVRISTHRTPSAGDPIGLRYPLRDPARAYAGSETSPWYKTIVVLSLAALFGIASLVLALLGHSGIL